MTSLHPDYCRTLLCKAFLLLLFAGLPACRGLAQDSSLSGNVGSLQPPVLWLERGEPCAVTDIRFLAPNSEAIDAWAAATAEGRLPGTYVYFARTARGTVKTLVTEGLSTPLSGLSFGSVLEIRPDTHPVDIRFSDDPMNPQSRFSFTVLRDGAPCTEPVRYTASRFGRLPDAAAAQAAEDPKETLMGKGRVNIDEPGVWWITAQAPSAEGDGPLASLVFTVPASPGPDHYAAFLSSGAYLGSMDEIAAALKDADVVFLGESHNDPVAHLLEREILEALHKTSGKIALSLEMFETDVQPILDGYLKGVYTETHFLDAARPWPHYRTDYRPMVEYAKAEGLPVIAANAPRRIVNLVSRSGPEALKDLSPAELRWIAPPDYYIPKEGRYVEKLREVFASFMPPKGPAEKSGPPRRKREWIALGEPSLEAFDKALEEKSGEGGGSHGGMPPGMMAHLAAAAGGDGYPSQSLWDATMAQSIARFLDQHSGTQVMQVNGAFHSDERLGIVEQLERMRPGTRAAVVSMVPHASFPAFDKEALAGRGDLVILTDPTWQPEEEP